MLLLLLRMNRFCHICDLWMIVKVRRGWQFGFAAVGLSTPSPYSPIAMIFDVGSEWVTFWKNILSLFGGVGINRFAGNGRVTILADGLRTVWGQT